VDFPTVQAAVLVAVAFRTLRAVDLAGVVEADIRAAAAVSPAVAAIAEW